VPELSLLAWALLAFAAAVGGLSKSAIPGSVTISVAIFAAALPAKESTGALLVLLILGDLCAIWVYRRSVEWRILIRLIPAVLVGLVLGFGFLARTTDRQVAVAIGLILLVVITLALYQRRAAPTRQARSARVLYGAAGGFTTMVANAAGPVMSMYFLASRLPIRVFLGTAAWFFGVLNLIKLPFSVQLGLVTAESLRMNLALAPALLAGFVCGRLLVRRMNQQIFERLVIVFTVVGAGYLLAQGFLPTP